VCALRDPVDNVNSRHFSTSSPQDRLSRTLYRQLLRWCQDTGDDIPLSKYVPPVTTMPPIVDQDAMRLLHEGKDENHEIRNLLPSSSMFEHNMMTVPLRKASDIKNFFRAVYRMNASNAADLSDEVRKQRVSMAFETLKSVNELTGALQDIKKQREKHLNRDGVNFCIGQVVQHKRDRWRGIVLGWELMTPSNQLTSLTTKDYANVEESSESAGEEENNRVRYTMLLDSGDSHLLGGSRQIQGDTGYPASFQSDLELVTDLSLCRIRGARVPHFFDRFDATSKCFVPNESQQYEYPLDDAHLETTEQEAVAAVVRAEVGDQMVVAIQSFARRLERRILDETSSAETRGLNVVVDFQHRLGRLASGDVMTDEDRLTKAEITDDHLATLHLRWLLNLSLELGEILWQRRISAEAVSGLKFRLGDIVHHKKYDFRGVVVAWDPKPSIDVSKWDGLGDVEDPNEKPFYHVIPDQSDCIQAFGGERPFRYVCEDNLEFCPRHRTLVDVDLDLDWENDTTEARYIAPYDLRVS
jgi:hemimethylated DNA binding protein